MVTAGRPSGVLPPSSLATVISRRQAERRSAPWFLMAEKYARPRLALQHHGGPAVHVAAGDVGSCRRRSRPRAYEADRLDVDASIAGILLGRLGRTRDHLRAASPPLAGRRVLVGVGREERGDYTFVARVARVHVLLDERLDRCFIRRRWSLRSQPRHRDQSENDDAHMGQNNRKSPVYFLG